MKFLNIILFYVYINSVLSQHPEKETRRFLVKRLPKKVGPGFVQINYSGKYQKPKNNNESPVVDSKKAFYEIPIRPLSLGNSYTAFDPMSQLYNFYITSKPIRPNAHDKTYTAFMQMNHPYATQGPDSLLYPNNLPDEKPRVKKTLPDDAWFSLRKKRSADNAIVKSDKVDNKTKPEALKTNETKDAAHVEKKGDKPIENKEEKQVEKKGDKDVEKKGDKDVEKKGDKGVKKKGDKGVENKGVKPVERKEGEHVVNRRKKHVKQKGVRLAGKKTGNMTKRGKKLRKGRPIKNVVRHKVKGHRNGTRTKQIRKQRKGQGKGKRRRHLRKSLSNDTRRLIAARDALIEQYPYAISIQKNDEHWCGGAILNPRLIITTANCLWKSSQISRMKVRVGTSYNNHGGQTFKIQEVMKHPGWKIRKNPDCDVALALLDKNIRFSHSVHGVDLPNIAMLPAFDDAWIVSWGSERRDGIFDSASNSLQVHHVRLMDKNKCNNITKRFGVIVTENFICLAQTGRRGPCTRDTGAPAVSDGMLWGLASWGIRKLCGTERYPAMFTYLASAANIDFIANATHQLMSEQRHYPFPDKLPRLRAVPVTPDKEPDTREDIKNLWINK